MMAARDTMDAAAMRDAPRCHVGMGEVKIGGSSDVLHAILGSCVGIAFIWKRGGRCALAHCLLPEAPRTGDCGVGARYVSQAIPSMLTLLGARQADYPDIEVVVAGGASMFRGTHFHIGEQNAAAAQKYLAECGLNVSYCDLGGRCGRQMSIDCARLCVMVTPIASQH